MRCLCYYSNQQNAENSNFIARKVIMLFVPIVIASYNTIHQVIMRLLIDWMLYFVMEIKQKWRNTLQSKWRHKMKYSRTQNGKMVKFPGYRFIGNNLSHKWPIRILSVIWMGACCFCVCVLCIFALNEHKSVISHTSRSIFRNEYVNVMTFHKFSLKSAFVDA